MDVRCERCKTEYEFDEARLTEAGVAVKCTTCGNVFKVRRPDVPRSAIPIDSRPREWKVRRDRGPPFTVKDLPELQRWIVERRVARDDELSLTGESWKSLRSMPELASFFEVVEAAEHAQRHPAPEPRGAAPKTSASWEESPQQIPAPTTPEPAWASGPSPAPSDDELESEDLKHLRSSRVPLVLFILALLAAGFGATYWFTRPPVAPPTPAKPLALEKSPPPPPIAAPVPAPPPALNPPASPTGPTQAAPPKVATAVAPAATEPKVEPKPELKAEPAVAPRSEAEAKPKPGHDFNWYLRQGHKLLDTHPKEALALFAHASEENPSSPEPDSGRGIAYSNLERWDSAISAFQAALKKSPGYIEAVMGLAEAYRYRGAKEKAIIYYRKYLDLAPNGPDAPAAKAQIESLQGD